MSEARKIGSVLIVDDVLALILTMEEHVLRSNLSTTAAGAHAEALKISQELKPDVVIASLDPGQNDPGLLRDLRNLGDVSVIVVESRRGEHDKVVRFESGADECLSKMRELLVRVDALVTSRLVAPVEAPKRSQSGKWLFGGWELRLKTRQLRDPSGTLVPLTQGEYALLFAFLEAAERPLSREYLQRATRVHGEISDRSIDVQILRLRRKLETDARAPRLIKTKRGVGYVFSIPAQLLDV
ncbi:DNA-binding response regulator [Mesorhizobium sp. SARCC-RB16n]|uniref:winged helix-turn-helix domain-containing protein n=1 Tax=Mesorhizobium sp. SARCC-RB16n TaxID=2116687 RepID=UPI00122F50FF|nr:winged helix-turn-helix domain-containing protein [Mesorhizobium sp. SARCC-RB16n]KAA3448001.1 DNA-binding response regulator [Mesorhizobium sp. SARCC-RB16n]